VFDLILPNGQHLVDGIDDDADDVAPGVDDNDFRVLAHFRLDAKAAGEVMDCHYAST